MFSTRNKYLFNEEIRSNYSLNLAFSNEKVAMYNFDQLQKVGKGICSIEALHNNKLAKKISVNDFGGLEPIVNLTGAEVILTRNLWTVAGLCNGSRGQC